MNELQRVVGGLQKVRGGFNNGWKGRSARPHSQTYHATSALQSFPILWWLERLDQMLGRSVLKRAFLSS